MFTGLIEEIGTLHSVEQMRSGRRLSIGATVVMNGLRQSDSISVDGVCLTVTDRSASDFSVEVVDETLHRSTLAKVGIGQAVNLERALRADSRLGGHFVQGHVDGVGEILSIKAQDLGLWLQIKAAKAITELLVEKGSVALDGVSLTIAELSDDVVGVAVIPYTLQHTTIGKKKVGDILNIEVDILGKYVRRFLQSYQTSNTISMDKLKQWGF